MSNKLKELIHELYDDMLKKQTPMFENKKLYDYLSKDYTVTEKLIRKWYGEKPAEQLISKISAINPEYVTFLANPGFALRIDKFTEFTSKNYDTLSKKNSFEVLSEFSDYLNNEYKKQYGVPYKVYRGMTLNNSQCDNIKTNGLISAGLRQGNSLNKQMFENFLSQDSRDWYGTSIKRDINMRLQGSTVCNRTISVSQYKDVAEFAGKEYGKSSLNPFSSSNVYLLEIETPILSVVTPENIFKECHLNKKFELNSKMYDCDKDIGIENFMFDIIPSNRIKTFTKIKSIASRELNPKLLNSVGSRKKDEIGLSI